MKVKQLIKKLEKINPDSNIWFELKLSKIIGDYIDVPSELYVDLHDPFLNGEYESDKFPEDNHVFCTFKPKRRGQR